MTELARGRGEQATSASQQARPLQPELLAQFLEHLQFLFKHHQPHRIKQENAPQSTLQSSALLAQGRPNAPTAMVPMQILYDLCSGQGPWSLEEVYGELRDWLQRHCTLVLERLLASQVSVSVYDEEWTAFHVASQQMGVVCHHLNRMVRANMGMLLV
jgi:hypothetical protein